MSTIEFAKMGELGKPMEAIALKSHFLHGTA
jgi:hypothetical protein